MSHSFSIIWVGMVLNTGSILVFDPDLQEPLQSKINVYSVKRNIIRQFNPSDIRTKVITIHGEDRTNALASYMLWKNDIGKNYLKNIEAEKRNVIIERHKNFMETNGHEYAGIKSGHSVHRKTHCWSCKDNLDNQIDVECIVCKWIVCKCGACGCAIRKHYQEQNY